MVAPITRTESYTDGSVEVTIDDNHVSSLTKEEPTEPDVVVKAQELYQEAQALQQKESYQKAENLYVSTLLLLPPDFVASSKTLNPVDDKMEVCFRLYVQCNIQLAICYSHLSDFSLSQTHASRALAAMCEDDKKSRWLGEWRCKALMVSSRALARLGQRKQARTMLNQARSLIQSHHLQRRPPAADGRPPVVAAPIAQKKPPRPPSPPVKDFEIVVKPGGNCDSSAASSQLTAPTVASATVASNAMEAATTVVTATEAAATAEKSSLRSSSPVAFPADITKVPEDQITKLRASPPTLPGTKAAATSQQDTVREQARLQVEVILPHDDTDDAGNSPLSSPDGNDPSYQPVAVVTTEKVNGRTQFLPIENGEESGVVHPSSTCQPIAVSADEVNGVIQEEPGDCHPNSTCQRIAVSSEEVNGMIQFLPIENGEESLHGQGSRAREENGETSVGEEEIQENKPELGASSGDRQDDDVNMSQGDPVIVCRKSSSSSQTGDGDSVSSMSSADTAAATRQQLRVSSSWSIESSRNTGEHSASAANLLPSPSWPLAGASRSEVKKKKLQFSQVEVSDEERAKLRAYVRPKNRMSKPTTRRRQYQMIGPGAGYANRSSRATSHASSRATAIMNLKLSEQQQRRFQESVRTSSSCRKPPRPPAKQTRSLQVWNPADDVSRTSDDSSWWRQLPSLCSDLYGSVNSGGEAWSRPPKDGDGIPSPFATIAQSLSMVYAAAIGMGDTQLLLSSTSADRKTRHRAKPPPLLFPPSAWMPPPETSGTSFVLKNSCIDSVAGAALIDAADVLTGTHQTPTAPRNPPKTNDSSSVRSMWMSMSSVTTGSAASSVVTGEGSRQAPKQSLLGGIKSADDLSVSLNGELQLQQHKSSTNGADWCTQIVDLASDVAQQEELFAALAGCTATASAAALLLNSTDSSSERPVMWMVGGSLVAAAGFHMWQQQQNNTRRSIMLGAPREQGGSEGMGRHVHIMGRHVQVMCEDWSECLRRNAVTITRGLGDAEERLVRHAEVMYRDLKQSLVETSSLVISPELDGDSADEEDAGRTHKTATKLTTQNQQKDCSHAATAASSSSTTKETYRSRFDSFYCGWKDRIQKRIVQQFMG